MVFDHFYYLLVTLAAFSLAESIYSLREGFRYLHLFRQAAHGTASNWTPPLTLIVPCRGLDPGLKHNLRAFAELVYPDYQLLLVLDSQSDPSWPILMGIQREFPQVSIQLLVAGPASGCGQKVHNLLHALDRLRPNDEVVAFGDSDIRPHRQWLRDLVTGLESDQVGVSSGFRWYLPQQGDFASRLRAVWNGGIASLMKSPDSPFAWGGAMALRTQTLVDCRIREKWQGSLSDDFSLSHNVHQNGLLIRFVPRCLSFSLEDCSFADLLHWSYRQLAITRIYNPGLWRLALAAHLISVSALWGGLGWIAWALIGGEADLRVLVLSGLLAAVYGLGAWKARLRLLAVGMLFPGHRAALNSNWLAHLLWGPLAALLSLLGLLRSMRSRTIEWRGIRYNMISQNQTEILSSD